MRSGYSDELDPWDHICWRGAVKSAIRGRRGQAALRELADALDAMDPQELIAGELRDPETGSVCALGLLGERRGVELDDLDPHDSHEIAAAFGVSSALICELEFINDNDFALRSESPAERWRRVRRWVAEHLRSPQEATS